MAKPKASEREENPINRRLYARFPVILPTKIVRDKSDKELAGEILDIGLGGALVRVPIPLKGEIRISFELEGIECVFDAYVVRRADGPKDSNLLLYGVEFHPNWEMEKKLKSLLPPKT